MKTYQEIAEIPLEVKKDIRSAVHCAVINASNWRPEVQEICNIEDIDIDCQGVQNCVLNQLVVSEHETRPWWKQ